MGVFEVITWIGWLVVSGAVIGGALLFDQGFTLQAIVALASGGIGGVMIAGLGQIGVAVRRSAEAMEGLVRLEEEKARPASSSVRRSSSVGSRSLASVYKGRSIEKTSAGFEVDGEAFDSLDAARRFIDQRTVAPRP